MTNSVNHAQAQESKIELNLYYTTDIQSDFGKKANWVNLLELEGACRPWQNGEIAIHAISVWKTRKKRIADDLQTFSNIEEDNMALNIFRMGYMHYFKNFRLFGGIRNVNEDYFIADYTSLFTNSSCGIYPTLSINFPVANYPLSAMCLHGEFEISKTITLKNSLYNGTARELFSEGGSLFTVNPQCEGILNITELSYLSKTNKYEFYNIGGLLYTGNSFHTGNRDEKSKINYTLWGSIEKVIYSLQHKSIGFLLQGSYAPADRNDCKYYYGLGAILSSIIPTRNENQLGLFFNHAVFRQDREQTLEITWKYMINRQIVLQPTIHCIHTNSSIKVVGLLRLCYDI